MSITFHAFVAGKLESAVGTEGSIVRYSVQSLSEKGYCWFLEPFAMLFMQLKGQVVFGIHPLGSITM